MTAKGPIALQMNLRYYSTPLCVRIVSAIVRAKSNKSTTTGRLDVPVRLLTFYQDKNNQTKKTSEKENEIAKSRRRSRKKNRWREDRKSLLGFRELGKGIVYFFQMFSTYLYLERNSPDVHGRKRSKENLADIGIFSPLSTVHKSENRSMKTVIEINSDIIIIKKENQRPISKQASHWSHCRKRKKAKRPNKKCIKSSLID